MNISVIIRCRNEERWIGHSIQSVLDFIDDPEIIIADNNSSDESMDIVRGFETWENIHKINIEDYSPGRSLNRAVELSSKDYILILSAHCCLTDCDVEIAKRELDSGHVAVFGKQVPKYRGRRISFRNVWSHFVDEEVINMWSDIEDRYFLHNAMCFYKRDFLLNNPFDEKLYGKEDRYWIKDMVDKGHTFLYTPRITCDHHWTTIGATWKGIG
jgi:glycosyltransferase involved in cell wall biosynthesis